MSEEAPPYQTRPNNLKEFLASPEQFFVKGTCYEIRRQDIPELLNLLTEYHSAFREALDSGLKAS